MITQIDLKILDFLQTLRTPVLDAILKFITYLGDDGIIWIVLTLAFLCFKKTRRYGIIMAISLVAGTVIGNMVIKNIVARARPFTVNPDILPSLIIAPPDSYSFPSGHTLASFECATALFMCNKKMGIPALILAALIGFSRNYLYVHYPTDVIVGALLGIAIGIGVYLLYNKYISGKYKIGKFEL